MDRIEAQVKELAETVARLAGENGGNLIQQALAKDPEAVTRAVADSLTRRTAAAQIITDMVKR